MRHLVHDSSLSRMRGSELEHVGWFVSCSPADGTRSTAKRIITLSMLILVGEIQVSPVVNEVQIGQVALRRMRGNLVSGLQMFEVM